MTPPRRSPRILPTGGLSERPGFVGRKSERASIVRRLAERRPVALVPADGQPGMGASSLMAQMVTEAQGGGMVLVWSVWRHGETPWDAVRGWLDGLGVSPAGDLGDRLSDLRDALAGHRVLVCLDDLRQGDLPAVESVLEHLPTHAAVLLASDDVVLARRMGATLVPIPSLSEQEAVLLVERIAGPRHGGGARALVEQGLRRPLSLRLAAWGLRAGMAPLADEVPSGLPGPKDVQRAFVARYRALSPATREALHAVGHARAAVLDAESLAWVAGLDPDEAQDHLWALSDAGILEPTGAPGRFDLHRLLSDVVRGVAGAEDAQAWRARRARDVVSPALWSTTRIRRDLVPLVRSMIADRDRAALGRLPAEVPEALRAADLGFLAQVVEKDRPSRVRRPAVAQIVVPAGAPPPESAAPKVRPLPLAASVHRVPSRREDNPTVFRTRPSRAELDEAAAPTGTGGADMTRLVDRRAVKRALAEEREPVAEGADPRPADAEADDLSLEGIDAEKGDHTPQDGRTRGRARQVVDDLVASASQEASAFRDVVSQLTERLDALDVRRGKEGRARLQGLEVELQEAQSVLDRAGLRFDVADDREVEAVLSEVFRAARATSSCLASVRVWQEELRASQEEQEATRRKQAVRTARKLSKGLSERWESEARQARDVLGDVEDAGHEAALRATLSVAGRAVAGASDAVDAVADADRVESAAAALEALRARVQAAEDAIAEVERARREAEAALEAARAERSARLVAAVTAIEAHLDAVEAARATLPGAVPEVDREVSLLRRHLTEARALGPGRRPEDATAAAARAETLRGEAEAARAAFDVALASARAALAREAVRARARALLAEAPPESAGVEDAARAWSEARDDVAERLDDDGCPVETLEDRLQRLQAAHAALVAAAEAEAMRRVAAEVEFEAMADDLSTRLQTWGGVLPSADGLRASLDGLRAQAVEEGAPVGDALSALRRTVDAAVADARGPLDARLDDLRSRLSDRPELPDVDAVLAELEGPEEVALAQGLLGASMSVDQARSARSAALAAEAPDDPEALDAAARACQEALDADEAARAVAEEALRAVAEARAARAAAQAAEAEAEAEAARASAEASRAAAQAAVDAAAGALARARRCWCAPGVLSDPMRRRARLRLAGLEARLAAGADPAEIVAGCERLVRGLAAIPRRRRVPPGGADRAAAVATAEAVVAARRGDLGDVVATLRAVEPGPGAERAWAAWAAWEDAARRVIRVAATPGLHVSTDLLQARTEAVLDALAETRPRREAPPGASGDRLGPAPRPGSSVRGRDAAILAWSRVVADAALGLRG